MICCVHSLYSALGMFRARVFLFAVTTLLCWPVGFALASSLHAVTPIPDDMALDELCLRQAYPHAVEGLEREGDTVWLRLRNGRQVIYADETKPLRDADGALREATVQQSMAEPYPLGAPDTLTPQGNAGRDRSAALLTALYGNSPRALRLDSVRFGHESLRLSGEAAAAFSRVAAELEPLARNPQLAKFIFPLGGGQNWRSIAGTQRLSAHAYGIAVDLNPKAGPYWRWTPQRKELYPQEIVKIFERHGFIWGGRWARFDVMHFEYRPEIICKSRHQQGRAAVQSERHLF